MKNSLLFKLFSSIPIILILLYFIPFLGICLLLLKLFNSSDKNKRRTIISSILVGLILLIPKGIGIFSNMLHYNINSIEYLSSIINNTTYNVDIIKYSKFIITVSIICVIIIVIIEKLLYQVGRIIKDYINNIEQKNMNISKDNDMKIKLKQEWAQNTSYVKCTYCGSDNIISEKFAICSYCRRKIENQNYKK
ncbi:MAG: hypothetical protein ACK5HL_00020 [Bacilli bacterium]